ncbi:thiol-disulfide oxidoreductase [Lysinibacillus sp. 2017]|uniref:peroxiredoxin family protein n=1 Tax=unclassified Lysinibacillus TaxID=2636778 RepID=UPI000D529B24|nr:MULTISPECIES: TlpA disulfide reductase family protein [unclassified Lysinibacillus]AWE06424.1 thiol-disulfide oxidoreductase [Lysinibacillus sp. 2017]TGN31182.1 TlpA family protein disulfide reductase [Lysinibacillus sp. S2017]
MKKNIGIIIVLALVVTMLGTYIKKEIDRSNAINEHAKGYEVALGEQVGLEKDQLAPDFTLFNLQGEEVTLSDLQGKRVVLNFWATWCPPCEAEMPHMQKYYDKYSEEDNVEIIGVNLTYSKEKLERVEQFVQNYNIKFPVLLEMDESVASQYEILTIPSTFMIDTEGRIQKKILGPLDLDALRNNVKQLN